jgi:hypothetical protein
MLLPHRPRGVKLPAEVEANAEVLIPDPRAGLSPSALVELKLAGLLEKHGQVISHMVCCRLSSRDRGRLREIEKLRGDQRLACMPAVGEAANVFTKEQRKALLGRTADKPDKAPGLTRR